jgi:hypothetical protein
VPLVVSAVLQGPQRERLFTAAAAAAAATEAAAAVGDYTNGSADTVLMQWG